MGAASGISMALFGLSPLSISILARTFFTDRKTGLNATRFFTFMAILTGTVHLMSALVFPAPLKDVKPVVAVAGDEGGDRAGFEVEDGEDDNALEEDPLLLSNKPVADVRAVQEPQMGTVLDLLRDPHFWMLAVSLSIVLGSVRYIIMISISSFYLRYSQALLSGRDDFGKLGLNRHVSSLKLDLRQHRLTSLTLLHLQHGVTDSHGPPCRCRIAASVLLA